MANENYTPPPGPYEAAPLSETLQYGFNNVTTFAKKFGQGLDDAMSMVPTDAALWLGGLAALATWAIFRQVHLGPRDSGLARISTSIALAVGMYAVGSYTHDAFLESKGYTIRGSDQRHEQIRVHPSKSSPQRADSAPVLKSRCPKATPDC